MKYCTTPLAYVTARCHTAISLYQQPQSGPCRLPLDLHLPAIVSKAATKIRVRRAAHPACITLPAHPACITLPHSSLTFLAPLKAVRTLSAAYTPHLSTSTMPSSTSTSGYTPSSTSGASSPERDTRHHGGRLRLAPVPVLAVASVMLACAQATRGASKKGQRGGCLGGLQ